MDDTAVFRLVEHTDIEIVQNFIRTELHRILLLKSVEIGFSYGEKEYPNFFGSFALAHSEFTFSSRDILIIQLLVEHVKSIENLDIEYDDFLSYSEEKSSKFFFQDVTCQLAEESNDQEYKVGPVPKISSRTHIFLNKLLNTADRNALRSKPGYRYDYETRKFASYLRILCGPLAYQTIQQNMPLALPTLTSTNRYIFHGHVKLIEGQLRIEELSEYLNQRNLPRVVTLSEDATRINGVPQYSSKSNEISGFVLPLDSQGMPTPHNYPARSFKEIYGHFRNGSSCAHFVNVIMAQPMANVPAFCILLFGSNSEYTAEDVAHRWEYISNELKRANIRVLAVASDSEPKYNSAMRKCTQLGIHSNVFEGVDWFCMSAYEELKDSQPVDQPYFVQDTIHIATKLRNMFLKTLKNPRMLPFGSKMYIQAQHIEYIISRFTKDQHRLTANVLNKEDKMNFESVLRLCDESVTKLLESNVPGSKATITFLEIIRDVIDAYRDTSLTPLQRIEKIWYVVFILRIWRDYISSSKHFTTEKNFLTSYCYACIEINAHSLILVMVDLKINNSSALFMPHLLESQPCESMFRQLRSMSTVYSTVTNCTLREIIDRINRIELQSEIAATSDFVFPRIKKTENIKSTSFELPTKDEIFEQVQNCKKKAIQFAIDVGLMKKVYKKDIELKCMIPPLTFKTRTIGQNESIMVRNKNLIQVETLKLTNYAEKFIDEDVPEKSIFVEVPGVKRRKIIKKSSLVWLLRNDVVKLSSDRLQRVRAHLSRKVKTRKSYLRKKQKISHFNFG